MKVDFGSVQVMCTEYRQEKKELIQALHDDKKQSNLPKITQVFSSFYSSMVQLILFLFSRSPSVVFFHMQPTLIIWGEYDQIFPLEMAHTLKRLVWKPSNILHIQGLHSS